MVLIVRKALSVGTAVAVSAALLVGVAAPASAAAVSIDPSEVHAGIYPEVFLTAADLDAMAAAAGGNGCRIVQYLQRHLERTEPRWRQRKRGGQLG